MSPMPMSHDMQAFMRRFARTALIAPADALGLSTIPTVASLITSHLSMTDEAREKDAEQHERNTLSAYGRKAAFGAGKGFPYAGNGTAIIPVHGVLINRYNYAGQGVTGYNAVRSMLNAAMADPDVTRIVLDIHSPGGQVSGCFELAADVRAAREVKPVHALVDGYAFSAAYALASAASSITLAPSAEAGSIGVVSMHMNIGPALKEFGIEISFIYAGKHKVDGNPYESLPDDVRAAVQADVDRIYGVFTAAVAEGRGSRMTDEQARATEAQCYCAEDALSLGLIDAIASPDAALASFEATNGGTTASNPSTMEKDENTMTDTIAQARADERARMAGILGHEEAKGRESLARHLAENTDMTVEQAAAALKVAPKAEAASGRNPLDAAMDRTEQPNVGADGGDPTAKGDDDSPKAKADRVWASFQAAGGAGLSSKGKSH